MFNTLICPALLGMHIPTTPLRLYRKTLVLAHREELLEQATQRIASVNPGLVVDIEAGARASHELADVVVASVPTLGRKHSARINKFNPSDYKVCLPNPAQCPRILPAAFRSSQLIVIDEAHHASADTYIRMSRACHHVRWARSPH